MSGLAHFAQRLSQQVTKLQESFQAGLLAKAGGAVRATLIASLQRLWNETLCWFGPNDDPTMQQLYAEGILDATPDELRGRYLQKIMPTLNNLDIDVPVSFDTTTKQWHVNAPLPWSTWDAVGRRLV